MFKIEEGTIEVDYNRIVAVYKYGVLYTDNGEVREIHLPQSMARIVKQRFEEYIGYEQEDSISGL